jgi:purine-binding chemotaxis protein CheW
VDRPREVVVFEVAGRRHGLAAGDVQELLRAALPAPLPGAPAAVEGVLNLRGRAVPVVDVRRRFGLPPRDLEPTDHLIVTRAAGRLIALRVDRVVDILRLGPADVEPGASLAPGGGVAWVAKTADGLVLVHGPSAFLSPAEADAAAAPPAPHA